MIQHNYLFTLCIHFNNRIKENLKKPVQTAQNLTQNLTQIDTNSEKNVPNNHFYKFLIN
jgi:hypothetical protein